MDEEKTLSTDVVVTDHMINSLRSTKPWTMFLSIIGFIGLAITVLAGLVLIVAGKFFSKSGNTYEMAFMGIFYILFSAIEIIPLLYLFKYSSAIGRFLDSRSNFDMESALAYQKSFWKFIGILCLIMMIVAAVGIVAAILIPTIIKLTS